MKHHFHLFFDLLIARILPGWGLTESLPRRTNHRFGFFYLEWPRASRQDQNLISQGCVWFTTNFWNYDSVTNEKLKLMAICYAYLANCSFSRRHIYAWSAKIFHSFWVKKIQIDGWFLLVMIRLTLTLGGFVELKDQKTDENDASLLANM